MEGISGFSSPLGAGHPVILAIGGEQKGLDWRLTKQAYAFVQIAPGINQLDVGVDSLNVSAASAILCAEFMRSRPKGFRDLDSKER
jgi:21S rRNA (GM2251-2'-O)-methyltransferase